MAKSREHKNSGACGGPKGKSAYREQYGVIVICADESHQKKIYEQLIARGLKCRVVVT